MDNELLRTAFRSLISVSVLFILARIMGKKQIAQLNFFDYVIGISIGSISAQAAIDESIKLSDELIGLVVFTAFSLVLSYISVKSYAGRRLLDGTPVVLIENGKIIEKGLKKTKLTVDDLLEECRQSNSFDIADIEFAILETSGKLSVMQKPEKQALTREDMHINATGQGLCANVIIDGKVIKEHLRMIRKDEQWLNGELVKQGVGSYGDVLLGYVDGNGRLTVVQRNVTGSYMSL